MYLHIDLQVFATFKNWMVESTSSGYPSFLFPWLVEISRNSQVLEPHGLGNVRLQHGARWGEKFEKLPAPAPCVSKNFKGGKINQLIWSNYSDLTRPHPKWWFSKGNPLISGKSRLVKYYNLARFMNKNMKQIKVIKNNILTKTCLFFVRNVSHAISHAC